MSQRRNGDEDGVTANRASATSRVLHDLAATLEERPWLLPRPLTAGTVEDAARTLLTHLRLRPWERFAAVLGTLDVPSAEVAAIDAERLPAAVRAEAERFAAAGARASVAALGEALVTMLEVAAGIPQPFTVDATASGAVALDLALRAPLERRTVARARTLVASDADWRVGAGPELRAPAAAIVLFLAGRGALPEHQPAPPAAPETPIG